MSAVCRALARERGQTSAEYVGVILVVAAIIAAIAASGIGEQVSAKIKQSIAELATGQGGEAGGGGAGGSEPGGEGSGPGGTEDGGSGPGSAPGEPEEQEDGGNLLTGAWEGLKDVGGELGDTAVGIGRHVNVFDLDAAGEQWQRTFETAEQVVTDPWESTKAIAGSFWDPIAESYAHGGLDEALGRGTVNAVGAVLGGKGLTKLGRADRVADAAPDRPRSPDDAARRERAERANCVSNSFTASTVVLMASGERRVIARVGVGERVVATDPETDVTGARAVEQVIVGEGRKTLVRVRASGEVIAATDRHPFWVESRRAWVDARDLRPGDRLRRAGGGLTRVDAVKVLDPRPKRVYNLTVSGLHTYYAGRRAVLVHNADCPEGASSRLVPGGGLSRHEAAGGHTIDRHVAKTDEELAQRLADEPARSVVSTFSDRATAERAIAETLDLRSGEVDVFLDSGKSQTVLTAPLGRPAGRSLERGAANAAPAENVRVVIRRSADLPDGYRIHTAYPEP